MISLDLLCEKQHLHLHFQSEPYEVASLEPAGCFCWWVTLKLLNLMLLSPLFLFNIYIVVTPTGHRPVEPFYGQLQPWAGFAVAGDDVRAIWSIMVITGQFSGFLPSVALSQLASDCPTRLKLAF